MDARALPLILGAAVLLGSLTSPAGAASPPSGGEALATADVVAGGEGRTTGYDGVVEAVRQTVVAAQVAGAVVALAVKAGDKVKAGQVLVRLDARAAEQNAAASAAQVQAARAALDAATRDYERQKQLFEKNYISQAALDQAEAQYKTATRPRLPHSSPAPAPHAPSRASTSCGRPTPAWSPTWASCWATWRCPASPC